ncbi:hypothetical protein PLESTB_001115000 [Pleodorina starrii]|uniref:Enoyl reductase (ER) domain-containing protein n=1 Tax=Pleodorina starrii TaxID=330485 RepID=A0A9W6BR26_9CHLO|nr:hypothetical protein PLESTM_001351800 [Pleodorina starrii]GLC56508.1 hypothetical protein PLESTB_001115000 [Pleodorina starrii]GLC68752.1 hypothetical protein PLESTF_000733000 [Pleodorina starrii]
MEYLPETMQALVLAEEERIEYRCVPCPRLVHPGDAIVRVTSCSVCGSDLHPYHGREKGIAPNTVVGHEFVGVVVAKGPEVMGLQLGDRVASPFTSCCGDCFYCRKGAPCRCNHTQAHLFGWVSEGEDKLPPTERRGLQGSQAQYVRVPLANGTLVKLPDDVSDEGGLLAGDILSTAFFCAERGEVGEGATVVVLGCGPVGLLCVMAAKHLGAGKIFAVDSVSERLAVAQELGAQPLHLQPSHRNAQQQPQPEQQECSPPPSSSSSSSEESGAVVAAVMAATEGRGADCVLEAVGANGALRLAYELVRPMGTISSVGVNTSASFPFSPVDAYNKNVTFRSGRCPARAYMTRLMHLLREPMPPTEATGTPAAAAAPPLPWRRIITHRMPLSQGPEAYDMFARRADGCIKIVLDPWAQ